MAVVDASVYVALVHADEPGHADSWAWLRSAQARREPLRAPAILAAEVAAAVGRGTNTPELSHQIVQQLLTFNVVELVPVSVHLAGRAAVVAADHRLRGCDAVYVALADQLDDVLVTLDRQQLERGADLVQTRRPTS
ncbi:MAG TPA: type II toxin-antitoxin system VapC family toxin [Thermoanaerobaculia bacterium]|jgi:predicted nucleic acid-binding protein